MGRGCPCVHVLTAHLLHRVPRRALCENARARACCAVSLCVQPRATLRDSECAVQVCQRFTRRVRERGVSSLRSHHVAQTRKRFEQGWDVTGQALQPHLRAQFGLHVSVRHT